jgi:hypothetical protein
MVEAVDVDQKQVLNSFSNLMSAAIDKELGSAKHVTLCKLVQVGEHKLIKIEHLNQVAALLLVVNLVASHGQVKQLGSWQDIHRL